MGLGDFVANGLNGFIPGSGDYVKNALPDTNNPAEFLWNMSLFGAYGSDGYLTRFAYDKAGVDLYGQYGGQPLGGGGSTKGGTTGYTGGGYQQPQQQINPALVALIVAVLAIIIVLFIF